MTKVSITFWVTPEEKEKIKRSARSSGLSLASLCRYLSLNYAEKRAKLWEDLSNG